METMKHLLSYHSLPARRHIIDYDLSGARRTQHEHIVLGQYLWYESIPLTESTTHQFSDHTACPYRPKYFTWQASFLTDWNNTSKSCDQDPSFVLFTSTWFTTPVLRVLHGCLKCRQFGGTCIIYVFIRLSAASRYALELCPTAVFDEQDGLEIRHSQIPFYTSEEDARCMQESGKGMNQVQVIWERPILFLNVLIYLTLLHASSVKCPARNERCAIMK